MDESALAMSMASLLVIAMICTILFKKLKMPAIIGYLATGIIMATFWQDMVDETTETVVSLLSALGLSLLMFSIGMELNFEKLKKSGSFAILIVLVQIPIVLIAGILFGKCFGWDFTLSIALGAILAGSSTAVVLVVQREKQVLDQEQVDILLLILVVEDVAQVIMMSVLTPMMETVAASLDVVQIAILLAKIIAFMVISTLVGIRFIPRALDWIGDNMDREILVLSALACCFILASLAVKAELSTAVGAFLMGVIVSKCKHVHTVYESVEPMKDIFMAMFFISIGLEVHPQDIFDNLLLMFAIFLLFAVSRTIAIYLGYFLGNRGGRIGFISATSLLTMGEFAFIISSMAYEAGIMSAGVHAAVIGAALISMIAQSFITGGAGTVYDKTMSKMPGFLTRFFTWATNFRDQSYLKMESMSKNGIRRMKRIITVAYCSGFAIIIVVLAFNYFGPYMVDRLTDIHEFSEIDAIRLVNLAEFLLLLLPISFMIVNIKSLLRYLTNPEERARGFVLESKQEEYVVRASSINLWIPTFIIDLAVMLFAPVRTNLAEQILISLIGIVLFLLIGYLMYVRSGKKLKSQE